MRGSAGGHRDLRGDFVLTGGEIPAMLLTQGRFVEGVWVAIGPRAGSFSEGLLEGPFTQGPEYRGMRVEALYPDQAIGRWRKKESRRRTFLRRREL